MFTLDKLLLKILKVSNITLHIHIHIIYKRKRDSWSYVIKFAERQIELLKNEIEFSLCPR